MCADPELVQAAKAAGGTKRGLYDPVYVVTGTSVARLVSSEKVPLVLSPLSKKAS